MSSHPPHHKTHSHRSKKTDAPTSRDEYNDSKSSNETSETADKVPSFCFKKKLITLPREPTVVCKEPLSVSPEFDACNSKRVESDYDRSYWEVELLRRHPEIKDLIDRVDPVARAATLASLYLPDRRLYPQEGILALISQHLKLLGLAQTATAIDESFAFPIEAPQHHNCSQLLHHLERGVLNADRFWCLLLPTPSYPTDIEAIQKQLKMQCNAVLGVIGGQKFESQPLDQESLEDLQSIQFSEDTKMPIKGTINQLVWEAASRYYNEKVTLPQTYVEIFAMTYHGFMSSALMLQKLKEVWKMFEKVGYKGSDKYELQFVSLVEKWIETSFFDFDAALLQNISQFLATIQTTRSGLQKRMQAALQKQMEGKQLDQIFEVQLTDIKIPENLFQSKFALTSIDVSELARQITMSSAKYYYAITPKELLDCAWSKPSIRHRSPNVIGLTNHFNLLADWVQYTILWAETIDERINLFVYFSKLAKELWDIRNFLDGFAIATAINANPIFRLKQHIALLPEHTMDPINLIIDATKSDDNFALMLQIHSEGQKQGACLPYIGVYLTQLTFFYDGNKDYIDDLVNFNKCIGVFKIIDKILSFQIKQFNYVVIEQIQEKLKEIKLHDEGELYAKSLAIEHNKITESEFKAQLMKERESKK